jgi:hypothetical protein
VYSLSSEPRIIVQQAVHSIRTLLSTTDPDPENIHLFFTPPVRDEDIEKFEELGVTVHIEKPDFPGGFRTRLGDSRAEYAEKWKLTKVDANTVVFLDCDTVVLDDLTDVVEGDFEFKARPISVDDPERWRDVFDRYSESYRPWYPNTGFLVFKGRTHKHIKDRWERYVRAEIPYYVEGYTKEQFALALATANCDFEPMTSQEHVMEWLDEVRTDGYLYHLANGDISIRQEVLNTIDGTLPAQIQDIFKSKFRGYYDAIEQK